MLARILPILALLVLCVLGYWLYAQGTIQQILRPTVVAVETARQMGEGQRVRKGFIVVREISLGEIKSGMITFPAGTTEEDVERALAGQTVARNIEEGVVLSSMMLGEGSGVIVLRARAAIASGDFLTLSNIEATTLEGAPSGGAIVFDSEEAAAVYVSKAFDLTSSRSIAVGEIITINDTSGGADKVFVVRTSRGFSRSDRLAGVGLVAAEISGKDMPSGAIAFQTRGAADVFITSAGKYTLSRGVSEGETITADLVSSASLEEVRATDELPRTLGELTSYINAYPDRAMLLDRTTFLGSRSARDGETLDIWIEDSRSAGAFGQITLERLSSGIPVRIAEDSSDPEVDEIEDLAARVSGRPTIGATLDESAAPGSATGADRERTFLWVVTDPAVKQTFDAARLADRIAFAVRSDDGLADLLGNGTTCLDDICRIDRSASADLAAVVAAMAASGEQGGMDGGDTLDPLTTMDGVSPVIEERLRNNGYTTFREISEWSDLDIPAVAIKIAITDNLALYIREQAIIISSAAENAARGLGFFEAPTE